MKTVFKIGKRPLGRLFQACGALVLACGALLALPAVAHAQTFYTPRQLLAEFFPTSEKVSYRQFDLSRDALERHRIEERLGYPLPRSRYTVFVATTGGHTDGYALFDDERGEHLPISFAVKFSPTGAVERQEVVTYREARGDEVRDRRFRQQFVGKTTRDRLHTGDDIVAVSGATISSRAMTVGVRRALVLLDELMLRPERAGTATASR